MSTRKRPRLLVAAVIIVAAALHLTQSEHSGAVAQQHNQSDVDFLQQRARLSAVEHRIDALNRRLVSLEHGGTVPIAQASGAEDVASRRTAGPAPSSRDSTAIRAREDGDAPAGRRIPATLRHRDRAVSTSDLDVFKNRLESMQQTTRSLGERLNRPDFGAGLQALEKDIAALETDISSFD